MLSCQYFHVETCARAEEKKNFFPHKCGKFLSTFRVHYTVQSCVHTRENFLALFVCTRARKKLALF